MDNNNNGSNNNQALKDKIALYDFIAELLTLRTDLNLSTEEKPLVIEQLVKELDYTINAHLMDLLSDQAVDEFNTLLDANPSDDQINDFFTKHIPNLSTEIAAAMLEFKTIFLYNPEGDAAAQKPAQAPMAAPSVQAPVANEAHEGDASMETPPPAPVTEN
jgi:hypothetical protein